MLFHQHGRRQPQEAFRVGEHTNHVCAAFDFPVKTPQRVGGPDLPPVGSGETSKREQVSFRVGEQLSCFRVDTLRHSHDLCVLGVNVFGVRLAENRPNKRRNHCLPALRKCCEGRQEERNPTALTRDPLLGHLNGGIESLVGVRDNQVNPVKTPISQLGEEVFPERFCFRMPNISSQYCSMPISSHTEGNNDCLGDNPLANTGFGAVGPAQSNCLALRLVYSPDFCFARFQAKECAKAFPRADLEMLFRLDRRIDPG